MAVSRNWGRYLHELEQRPLRTKMISASFIFSLSNIGSQFISYGELSNLKEVFAFATWGGIILSPLNHLWQAFIAAHGPEKLLPKIAVDHVFWKMPILWLFLLYQKLMAGVKPEKALQYANTTGGPTAPLQWTSVKVWPAVQVVNFTVVPLNLRVLYNNVAAAIWTLYLALAMRRGSRLRAASAAGIRPRDSTAEAHEAEGTTKADQRTSR